MIAGRLLWSSNRQKVSACNNLSHACPITPTSTSTATPPGSDGTLSPTALVQRARANGVDMLGLTDHDVLDGLSEAQAAAQTEDLPTISLSESRPRPSLSFIAARASAPA